MFVGQLSTGFSTSATVTLKLQVAVLPLASVTVQSTLVTPFAKRDPEGGEQTTSAFPQLSEAPMAKFTSASQRPGSAFKDRLPGQVITGFSLSSTLTLNEHAPRFPASSAAVQFTTVTPCVNNEPVGGTQFKVTALQLSLADT